MYNAYFNGSFCSADRISLPLTSRAVFFGDGIYDACLARNGVPFMLKEHTERFFENASLLGIPCPISRCELESVIKRLSAKSGCTFLYLQLSRAAAARTHSALRSGGADIFVTASPIAEPNAERTLRLITQPDKRHSMCHIKTICLLPAVLAATNAELAECDEAVLIRRGGVTEGSHSNVHIIRGGVLITHPLGKHVLPGISRAHLLSVAKNTGTRTVERPFTKNELYQADEVLITSTTRIAQRAREMDGIPLPLPPDGTGLRLIRHMHSEFITSTV